jgi:hypothetical protein
MLEAFKADGSHCHSDRVLVLPANISGLQLKERYDLVLPWHQVNETEIYEIKTLKTRITTGFFALFERTEQGFIYLELIEALRLESNTVYKGVAKVAIDFALWRHLQASNDSAVEVGLESKNRQRLIEYYKSLGGVNDEGNFFLFEMQRTADNLSLFTFENPSIPAY